MTRTDSPAGALQEAHIPVQAKLAAGWVSLMLLYVYVDILNLFLPGVVPDILEGRVFEFDISQTWALIALALMAIPISMIVLSTVLPAQGNRRANLAIAPVYVLVSAFTAVGESWTYYFGFAVGLELLVLAAIIRWAWTWPRATRAAVEHARVRAHA